MPKESRVTVDEMFAGDSVALALYLDHVVWSHDDTLGEMAHSNDSRM